MLYRPIPSQIQILLNLSIYLDSIGMKISWTQKRGLNSMLFLRYNIKKLMSIKTDFSQNIFRLAILALLVVMTTSQICTNHQYFNSTMGQCTFCDISCANCMSTSTNCTSCSSGYFQTNLTCTRCPTYCTSCTSLTICTGCALRYYLNNASCINCGINCMFCNSTACTHCQIGYKILDNCTTCEKQFYYNSTQGRCDMCMMGCLECSFKGSCVNCQVGYRLSGSGECVYLGGSRHDDGDDDDEQHQGRGSGKVVFIVIGAVLGSLAIFFCIACCVYHHVKRKKRATRPATRPNKIINNQSIIQKEFNFKCDNQFCAICKKNYAQLTSSCGHNFHNKCLSEHHKCPYCQDDCSINPTQLDEIQSGSKSQLIQNVNAEVLKLQEGDSHFSFE